MNLVGDVKQGRLFQVGRASYYVLADPEAPANAGIVVGDEATLVIDSRLTPALGHDVVATARALSGDDERTMYFVNTHYHGDHCFGNGAFAGMTGFGSRHTREMLTCEEDWRRQIASFLSRRPHLRPELEGLRPTVPAISVESAVEIDLGGAVARLETVGTAHSPGDLIVCVVDDRVTYTGDLVYHQHWPVLKYGQHAGWMSALSYLESLGDRFYVPGHGPGGGADMLRTIQAAWRLLERMAEADAGDEDVERMLRGSTFESWLRRERIAEILPQLRRDAR